MRTIKITKGRGFGAVMLELGYVLEELREAADLTRNGLATASRKNGVGISHTTVINLERGDGNVTLRTLRSICLAMGMEMELLILPAPQEKKA